MVVVVAAIVPIASKAMKNPWFELKTGLIGVICAAVGSISNLRVEAVNGGVMPVFAAGCTGFDEAAINATHACASAATHLAGLADWIQINGTIYSPGDFLITLGQVMTVVALVSFLHVSIRKRFFNSKRD